MTPMRILPLQLDDHWCMLMSTNNNVDHALQTDTTPTSDSVVLCIITIVTLTRVLLATIQGLLNQTHHMRESLGNTQRHLIQ
jgi:hypothetical protein